MRISLSRKVPVTCHKIHAEVAVFSETDYALAVLMYVDEEGGRATPRSMSKDLLADSDTISKRLLDFCSNQGLVERSGDRYRLTDEGRDAIRHGRTPVTKRQMWKIHLADDPLIRTPYRLLKIEEERHDVEWASQPNGKKAPIGDQPRPERLGPGILDLAGTKFLPSFGDTSPVKIKETKMFGKEVEPDLEAHVHWDLGEDGSRAWLSAGSAARTGGGDDYGKKHFDVLGLPMSATMKEVNERALEEIYRLMEKDGGKDTGNQKIERIRDAAKSIRDSYDHIQDRHGTSPHETRMLPVPDGNPYKIARQKLEDATGYEWDGERGRFLVRYADARPEWVESMTAELDETEITIDGSGSFQMAGTTIPIYPATPDDARRWARDMAEREMGSAYVTGKRHHAIMDGILERFQGHGDVLNRERSAYVPAERTRLYWNIQAMEDWDL